MNFKDLLDYAGRLKRIKRTGWVVRGIPEPESIADHSYRAALLGYFLALERGLDAGKVAGMLLVHDMGESLIGDITPEGERFMEKIEAEDKAMKFLADKIGSRKIYELWREFNYGTSPEAQLAREVDKAEMAYQALEYSNMGFPVYGDMLKYLPGYLK